MTWYQNQQHAPRIYSSLSSSSWQYTLERKILFLNTVIWTNYVLTRCEYSHSRFDWYSSKNNSTYFAARASLPFSPSFSRINLAQWLGYELDNRGIIVRFAVAERDISSPALGATQPPIHWVSGDLPHGVKRTGAWCLPLTCIQCRG